MLGQSTFESRKHPKFHISFWAQFCDLFCSTMTEFLKCGHCFWKQKENITIFSEFTSLNLWKVWKVFHMWQIPRSVFFKQLDFNDTFFTLQIFILINFFLDETKKEKKKKLKKETSFWKYLIPYLNFGLI